MGSPNNRKWSDIFDILKTWIPWKSEHLNMSRDFWMPDHSCGMCYECDSQFSLFNRRHHCRVCGRVFCAKCTENSIPASSNEVKTCRDDAERIRVCNYCFRQWKQGPVAVDHGVTASNPVLSPFPSETSLVSTQSSCTNNSGSSVGSMSYSTGHFQHVPYSSAGSHYQNKQMNEDTVGQNQASYAGISDSVDVRDHFSDKLDSYCRYLENTVTMLQSGVVYITMK